MNLGSSSRAFDILECLATEPEGLALGKICERVGTPKNLGHRALAGLIERGYVERDAGAGIYRLTFRLPLLGFRYLAAAGIHDACQPILDEVADVSGEYVALGVVDRDDLIWVASARGARSALRYEPVSGPVVRLYTTASGHAWLSTLPEEKAVEIVLRYGLELPPNYGKNAPKSIADFLKRLRTTRARGYGLALESGEPGIHVIAKAFAAGSPQSGPVVGTISIAGPAFRLDRARLESFYPMLKRASETLASVWPVRGRANIRSAIVEARADAKRGAA